MLTIAKGFEYEGGEDESKSVFIFILSVLSDTYRILNDSAQGYLCTQIITMRDTSSCDNQIPSFRLI